MTDELDMMAAEYVVGTLDGGERAAFAERLRRDGEARAAVGRWQARFAPLSDAVLPTEPPPALWTRIEAAALSGAGPASNPTAAPPDNVVQLKRRVAVWRGSAIAAMAAAAALAGIVVLDFTALDRATNAGERYVAVVDTEGREPALIVEVDTAAGTVLVRSLAAEAPAGRSLELWHVAEGAAPRSLGLLQRGDQAQVIEASVGGAEAEQAVFAVSVEPPGGSPTGAPTGPVVYTGRLIRTDE